MHLKRVLIVGASSFIGTHLSIYLRSFYQVFGTHSAHAMAADGVLPFKINLAQGNRIEDILATIKPDIVVYCAGITKNLSCKDDPVAATFLNATLPTDLAKRCNEQGVRFIYFSAADVFSAQEGGYTEESEASPRNELGLTKREAEQNLIRIPNTFVLRLGTAFGLGAIHHSQLFNKILYALKEKNTLHLISNEYRSYISVQDICRAVGVLIDTTSEMAGLYNLGSAFSLSFHDFAKEVALAFGVSPDPLQPISKKDATPIPEMYDDELEQYHYSLNPALFQQRFSFQLSTVRASLEEIRQKLETGLY